jgi:hypothetical protein
LVLEGADGAWLVRVRAFQRLLLTPKHIAVSRRLDRCLDVCERLRAPGSDAGTDITRIARSLGGEPEAGPRLGA